ncbi:hypothetical protein AVEN_46165-1 [Araneus ventricosus]|uniref:Uncharacterized protein n=1 Tax=Araneus ventricosus TaxID=182803 RepID=A0A4Y2D7N2_ARAVE|nr:hypothetical protein AVEN_46165-1 [Araneus ventricosus]
MPIAALQVIEGITPLHIKAEQEAVYVRIARLRKTSNYNNINFNHNNHEDGTTQQTAQQPPNSSQLFFKSKTESLHKSNSFQYPVLIFTRPTQRWKTKQAAPYVSWKATQRDVNGWCNFVPSTQSSKQSFLLRRRFVFGQARPPTG